MAPSSVLLGIALTLVPAAGFAYVGQTFRQRALGGASRTAAHRFATWWFAQAASGTLYASLTLLVALDYTPFALVLGAATLAASLNVVMFWGLLSYLAYVLTGRPGLFRVLTMLYATQFAFYAAVIAWHRPNAVIVEKLTPTIAFARTPSPATELAVALVFLAPPLIAAALYATIYFRTRPHQRTLRYRVALVSASILTLMTTAIVQAALGAPTEVTRTVVRIVAIAAAGTILAAYRPPSWVQRVLGVQPAPVDYESAEPPSPCERAARADDFARRAEELV